MRPNSAVHGSNWLHLQRVAQDAKTLVEIEMRKNSVVETFDSNTVVLVAFRFEMLTSFIHVRYIQKEEGYEKHMSFSDLSKRCHENGSSEGIQRPSQ